ncbi:MAG TPA: lysophospholipid acyltransferase family protein [Candidatus Omnitrophota bacterium]|nr:lysophospholipid acyltransferase family protein [Candidatus Omnitrophota bacterium]HPT39829.1 lysophospholipid acyltransferase family protein [Candidatus Omnitrophota bacterium]
MQKSPDQAKINPKKRGNRLGFWCFKVLLKFSGLPGAYALLYFVCLHYLIFDRNVRLKALSYIRRRFPHYNFFKSRLAVYRLFVSQGKQLVDRAAILGGKNLFDIQLKGYEQLSRLLDDKNQGFVLLTAHLGNWQIALTTLKKMAKPVYLVMRPEDNQAVKESLNIDAQDSFIKIISPEGYLGGVVESMQVLKEGGIVSIMGDRKYGFEAVEIEFLKDKAYFPFGAFSLAASSNCPIVVLLSVKLPGNKYSVDVSHILYPRYNSSRNKKEQLKVFVQQFADILNDYVEKYPYQCFLFHDVWDKN